MEIKFPLLSVLATALLAFFIFQGGDVELHSWKVGFFPSFNEVKVTFDPVWVVWVDSPYINTTLGTTLGNVSVIKESLRGTPRGDCVLAYELNHARQHYALGWWSYPLSLFIPIESHRMAEMWLPPPSWVDLWHFLSISVSLFH